MCVCVRERERERHTHTDLMAESVTHDDDKHNQPEKKTDGSKDRCRQQANTWLWKSVTNNETVESQH